MGTSAKIVKKALEYLIFSFFVVFPFGQLLKIKYQSGTLALRGNIIDIVVFVSVLLFFLSRYKKPKIFRFVNCFFYALFVSFAFSAFKIPFASQSIGFLYFVRLFVYSYFSFVVWLFVKDRKIKKTLVVNSLLLVSFFTGLFGWLQYLFLPDLRFLKLLGWDDHLFRLAGSFLDPGFAGIILTLGFCLSFYQLLARKEAKSIFLFLSLFFALSVLFTFSRASYLALSVGFALCLLSQIKNKLKFVFYGLSFVVLVSVAVYFLPKPAGQGVNLLRTYSIFYRLENYKQTYSIFQSNPILGVGYNNICFFRQELFQDIASSHACSGSDSSLLLLFATGGLLGVALYFYMLFGIYKSLPRGIYKDLLVICFGAVFVHSFFVNSLFYPWSLGFLAILLGVSIKDEK